MNARRATDALRTPHGLRRFLDYAAGAPGFGARNVLLIMSQSELPALPVPGGRDMLLVMPQMQAGRLTCVPVYYAKGEPPRTHLPLEAAVRALGRKPVQRESDLPVQALRAIYAEAAASYTDRSFMSPRSPETIFYAQVRTYIACRQLDIPTDTFEAREFQGLINSPAYADWRMDQSEDELIGCLTDASAGAHRTVQLLQRDVRALPAHDKPTRAAGTLEQNAEQEQRVVPQTRSRV